VKVYVDTGPGTAVRLSGFWLLIFAPFLVPIMLVRGLIAAVRTFR